MAKEIDWLNIKNDYINTQTSYRKLCDKYGVSLATLRNRAEKEGWTTQRTTQQHRIAEKIAQKSIDVIAEKQIDRIKRITTVADTLLEKLEQATAQLDNYLVTNRVKVKKAEYDPEAKGKLKTETTTETENIAIVAGIIDKNGLKQLTGALKDLKEIQSVATASDTQMEKLDEVLGKIGGKV